MNRYGRYHAQCWAVGRTMEELREEIAVSEARALTNYPWNMVGNVTQTHARIDTLKAVLDEGKILTEERLHEIWLGES